MSRRTTLTHQQAIAEASRRRKIERFEFVGPKVVRVQYTLVHSNNKDDLKRAAKKSLARIKKRIGTAAPRSHEYEEVSTRGLWTNDELAVRFADHYPHGWSGTAMG